MSGIELGVLMGVALVAWRAGAPRSLVLVVVLGSIGLLFMPRSAVDAPKVKVAPEARQMAGSDTCRGCHPGAWKTWQDSYHRTMTQLPSTEAVLGDFDSTLYLASERWRLAREGDGFYATRYGRDGRPNRARVALLTGSHHLQNYWLDVGKGWLVQLPFVWLIESGRWIPAKASFLQPPDEAPAPVIWNDGCIYCHTVAGARGAGLDARETLSTVGELGIACEACHGPSAQHVRDQRSPVRRYVGHWGEESVDDVIHPDRLDEDAKDAVCGQCHAVFMHRRPGERAAAGDGFRPGDALAETRLVLQLQSASSPKDEPFLPPLRDTTVSIEYAEGRRKLAVVGLAPRGLYVKSDVQRPSRVAFVLGGQRSKGRWISGGPGRPTRIKVGGWSAGAWRAALDVMGYVDLAVSVKDWDAFWRDGTVRTVGREQNGLAISPCATQGALTCTTCHDMHGQRPDNQVRPGFDGDQACAECHGDLVGAPEPHSHHPPEAAGCYDCHLPYTTYGLLGAARSHRIDIPSPRRMEAQGRPNACNLCHLDRTVSWAEAALTRWSGRPGDPFDGTETVAAGPRWLLAGDAAVRAVTAWHLGWDPARSTAGVDEWAPPLLSILMTDPYAAVRAIAGRSVAKGPDWAGRSYDFVGPPAGRNEAAKRLLEAWRARRRGPTKPGLLLGVDGVLEPTAGALLGRRDSRPVTVAE